MIAARFLPATHLPHHPGNGVAMLRLPVTVRTAAGF
jgi:hypothetical protein